MNPLTENHQTLETLTEFYTKMTTTSTNAEELCLQIESGKVVVTKDDPSALSLFQTFSFGRIDEATFPEVIEKIRADIAECDRETLNETDLSTLDSLIRLVNEVGRKTFSHLTNNYVRYYCFQTPFEKFQIETDTNVVSYSTPILRGLRNIGRNICWLNATIKYLAITEIFDEAFLEGLKTQKTHTVSLKFIRLLNALRSNWHQNIIDSLHSDLFTELKGKDPFSQLFGGRCQDMDEFLISLFAFLESHSTKPPMRTRKLILDREKVFIEAQEKIEHSLRIQVHAKPNISVDIPNEMLLNTSNDEGFTQEVIVDIPDQLNISICRANFNRRTGSSYLLSPIDFQPDGTIHLIKYKKSQPLEMHVFEPTCAILRKGSVQSGHFTCLEKTAQNACVEHNDSQVSANTQQNPFQHAFFLHLRRKEIRPF